jgi:hypothetical protein
MLSAVLAIGIGLGLWSLTVFFKKRGLQSRFVHDTRFDVNDSIYGYVTNTHFVLIASSLHKEILSFGRDRLQRIELGSEDDKTERKSAEVVVLEWRQDNGAPKVFKLDLYEPNSKEKAKRLLEFLRKNAEARA